jgi:hypothetical protein
MSWQNYVDQLMATEDFTHAGLDGSVWASTKGIPVSIKYLKTQNSKIIFI